MKTAPKLLFCLIAFMSGVIQGNGQASKWPIEKTSESLTFDGICDEPLWDNLKLIPMEMYRPNHGAAPTERSEIFVTFDDKYLYLYYSHNYGQIYTFWQKF